MLEMASQAPRFLPVIKDLLRRSAQSTTIVFRAPVADDELDELMRLADVQSVILSSPDESQSQRHQGRLGWWDSENLALVVPDRPGRQLIFFGIEWDLGFRVAFKAWRDGARSLHVVSPVTGYTRSNLFVVTVRQFLHSLNYRLGNSPVAPFLERFTRIYVRRQARKLRQLKVQPYSPVAGRVLLASGSLGPGGAERQIVNTLVGLKAVGLMDTSFVQERPLAPPHDFFYPELKKAGVACSQLVSIEAIAYGEQRLTRDFIDIYGILNSLGFPAARVLTYMLEFRNRRPEVIHTWLDDVNVAAGLAAILVGVPRVVIGCRSLAPSHFLFLQPYMKPIYRMLCERPNVVILNNSSAGAASYAAWLEIPLERIRVIHNGFDFPSTSLGMETLSRMSGFLQSEFGLPGRARVVGTVMRLSEEKDPELWIRAAKRISEALDDVYFLIAGDGPLRAKIEALTSSLGIAAKVRLLGQRHDVADLLPGMDVFMQTSRVEGLPNVLIEAQAFGVPVVATDVGGVSEVFDNGVTGLAVKERTPDAMAKAVLTIFADQEITARSREQAPALIRGRFSVRAMVDDTLEVYGVHAQS